jgi:hypothetical protein
MLMLVLKVVSLITVPPLYWCMEPTRGNYCRNDVKNIDELRDALREIEAAESAEERAELLSDILMNGHDGSGGYLTFGNNKIAKNTAIFNMNSATDCPNADSTESDQSEVGACQVPWESCYAHKAENIYPNALPKRRRQEYLWDHIDAQTFAEALLRVKERKRSSFDFLRLSESGDFRHRGDIVKANTIAKMIAPEIDVYTYSASHKLDWSESEHFTVNQSNALADYGDREFTALPEGADLPDNTVWCAFDISEKEGDDRPKCGECRLCINEEGPNVAIQIH